MEWADCGCCWPQKPKVRKAADWLILGSPGEPDEPVTPFWYVEIGGWPQGHFDSWDSALCAAGRYLRDEDYHWRRDPEAL